jgi:hypothetical protein
VPANNIPTTCDAQLDSAFTYALNVANGGSFTKAFPNYTNDSNAAGIETNAAGSVYVVMTAEGKPNIVYQKLSSTPDAQLIDIPSNIKAKRLTWIEQR